MSTTAVSPGESIDIQGTLSIASQAIAGIADMQAVAVPSLQGLSGPDGTETMRDATFASTFMTPTDLPIERQGRFFSAGIDSFTGIPLPLVAAERAEGNVDLSVTVPADLPAGLYRPRVFFLFVNVPEQPSATPLNLVFGRSGRGNGQTVLLPTVEVGSPQQPRLFMTLLSDTLSNGSRGTRALEDKQKFEISNRILTQSETFVVPRTDASGSPINYLLEPFAPTIGLSNEGVMSQPLVAFEFPSDGLTVTIEKPDGAIVELGPVPFKQSRMQTLKGIGGIDLDSGRGTLPIYFS